LRREIREWAARRNTSRQHRLKALDRYAQFAVASGEDGARRTPVLTYSREEPQHRVGVSFGTALGGISGAEISIRTS
jgi:3-oxoacyl-(acyl-carrier-protein) synthase